MDDYEQRYGKSVGYDMAYSEGYAAKYNEWPCRVNPYKPGSVEWDGYEEGYCEAVTFSC